MELEISASVAELLDDIRYSEGFRYLNPKHKEKINELCENYEYAVMGGYDAQVRKEEEDEQD